MKIIFNIEPEDCITALAQIIGMDGSIKSKKQFKEKLSTYFYMYGRLCLEDHQSENKIHNAEALETWNKWGEAIKSREMTQLEEKHNDALSEN